jgi:hypothetical protein
METFRPMSSIVRAGKARSCEKHKFTPEEDELLAWVVAEYGASDWKGIAAKVGTRNCRQCRERWKNYLDPCLSQDPWSKVEDELLSAKYRELGSQWSLIAKCFPARTDVNCRNRWVFLTTRMEQPKRIRRKKTQVPPEETEESPDPWVWNEAEMRQNYEEASTFEFYDGLRSLF